MAAQTVDKRRRKDRRQQGLFERRRLPRRKTEFWSWTARNLTKVGIVLGGAAWAWNEIDNSYEQYTVNRELVLKAEAERTKRTVDERIRWLEEQVIELRSQKKSP